MPPPQSVLILGGGLVGLATAYQLVRHSPASKITLLEKENALGQHQSTHNSGVIHAGLYYKPGSAKARLAVAGSRLMVQFCRDHNIAHDICGKLVVATNEAEIIQLHALHKRGQENGLHNLSWLQPEQIREIEPHAAGLAALKVPEEGIVDFGHVCRTIGEIIRQKGVHVVLHAEVQKLSLRGSNWIAQTTAGDFKGDYLVNCAGLYSDRICSLAGAHVSARIIPFRGEYYRLKKDRSNLVRNLIYPVPDPLFPFLGVHFTRLIHGGIEAGPNAVLAWKREGYRKGDFSLRDAWSTLSYGGFWKFSYQHARMCAREIAQSLSKNRFCAALQKLVPQIQPEDLEAGGTGVRAQAMAPSGELIQDFHLVERSQALHVLNAPSPAATASLAIGEEIAKIICKSN
jgi:(S)-2-hydroxyglutarate dehydrogenase